MKFRVIATPQMLYGLIENGVYFSIYYVLLFVVSLGEVLYKTFFYSYSSMSWTVKKIWSGLKSEAVQKSLIVLVRKSRIAIFRIPIFIITFLKAAFQFIESIVFWFLLLCISFYRFLKSIYFRYFLYGFISCIVVIFTYQCYLFIEDLPTPQSIGKVNFAQSTHLFDRNGKALYEIYRDVNRTKIKLSDIPPFVIQATIAIEDKQFYNHKGISFFGGILRAFKDTASTKKLQGGSTITQQLVKSALLTPERTFERKIKEIILALWTEQVYSKDQIMEMYLNQVPYGGSAYGIEEAAKVYFGKRANQLTISEAALLAGLTRAPSEYSPFINPKLAKWRRDQVLDLMKKYAYISASQYNRAIKEELHIQPPTTNIRAPHFVMYTRTYLENQYGSKQVEESGFRVITTLDLDIQEQAEQILREELLKLSQYNATNGGVIVLNPQTGEILAMVGSIDYFMSQTGAYNVTIALRQPGSSLKPMLYSLALSKGFTAASPIDDSPILFRIVGSESYQPLNYDRRYHGRVSLRQALANSYNVPAVKVLNSIGVSTYIEFAKTMGIDTWNDPSRFGLSLALGGGEVTLLDATQVYGVFANGGMRVEPIPVRTIFDDKSRKIHESYPYKVQVLDKGIAYIISDILADNDARTPAFGPNSSLAIPGYTVSAKTGTTNEYKDAWTIGYNPKVVVGVWVGNNDNKPMHSVAGSLGAAPIFNRLMTFLIKEKGMYVEVDKPDNVIEKSCFTGKKEYFLAGTESKARCFTTVIGPVSPTPGTDSQPSN